MDIILIIFGIIAMLVGLAGCVLPMLPGPPIAYAGLLCLHFTDAYEIPTPKLVVWFLIVVVIQILDYLVPMLGTKYYGGSRLGNFGCLVGTIIGLFFLPWGIIVGPFVGAVIGEIISGRTSSEALKSGIGSLLGFLFGTVLKLVVCLYFCVEFALTLS